MIIRFVLLSFISLTIACTGCIGYYDRDYDHRGYEEYRDRERWQHEERREHDHDRDSGDRGDRNHDRDHDDPRDSRER
ncbi:MAG TPA: hypothetical protein VK452_04680 [Dissulfurispiraceae bacterium]|nr:hypothetical protein [Dissulfurispiraceae bacterium]